MTSNESNKEKRISINSENFVIINDTMYINLKAEEVAEIIAEYAFGSNTNRDDYVIEAKPATIKIPFPKESE